MEHKLYWNRAEFPYFPIKGPDICETLFIFSKAALSTQTLYQEYRNKVCLTFKHTLAKY